MSLEDNFLEAVKKLRQTERKRNFDQTIDLIINLKDFDLRRQAFNIFIELPFKFKNKKIAAFLENDSKLVDVIKKEDFSKFKEKKDIKKLIRIYDAFIANAKLMPAVATTFGRILGPAGKMPSPQLGIITSEDEETIKRIIEKINKTIRLRVKELSIKAGVAKESMNDEEIVKNLVTTYTKILETLPKKKDNIKNVKIKLTMDSPVDVKI